MLDSLMLSPSQQSLLNEAAHRYHENLGEAADYLEGRGVTETVARSSLLGKCSDPLPGHERFRDWLSIPYVTLGGVVAMKFRNLDDTAEQRYDAPAGLKIRLYNARALAEGGDVVLICEGEMDTLIALSQLGVPAVGSWGTNWLDHWSRCFGDYDRVIVVGDNDTKADGSNPGKKHAEKVVKAVSGAELVLPPPGHDLGSWVAKNGAEGVRERLGL